MCGMLSLGRTCLWPWELSAAVPICAEVHETVPINVSHRSGEGFMRPHSSLRTYRQSMMTKKEALLQPWKH